MTDALKTTVTVVNGGEFNEISVNDWESVYTLREHGTIFYQEFHAIKPIEGYHCLAAFYGNGIAGYLTPDELGLDKPTERDLQAFLKMPVPVKINGILRREGIVLLSRRIAVEHLSRIFWNTATTGMRVLGTVLTPPKIKESMYLEVYGIKAEVPYNEYTWMQWIYPKELQEMFPLYSQVEAVVKEMDPENKKLVVSTKKTRPDPWKSGEVEEMYPPDSICSAEVLEAKPFGTFVRLPGGYVCLADKLNGAQPGQKVSVKIKKINFNKRKMYGVGLPQA